ncbi:phosphoribosylanthranilate isomerase [Janthinobacterium sp. 17J80-10]|uniref:phosphoribosylanthranilate isomerase n=1 Tax=Janthinobacterium sp. 17J80-10 TaxID=2497863 RepID=UPI0010054BD7|nr:phosphoribosylanthranilate isomerase [Janthinobacterium sp. 17J80-10]QAU34733.1 phosphoribosylanthranilate isomerase [Janthinobacterium sp. 17J80-10]
MSHRTRIKICGMTRPEDVHAAAVAGADALGFVFYDKSPRHVSAAQARALMAHVPPFVTAVGLFVNAGADEVAAVLATAPISLLQFHGDETLEQCCEIASRVRRPFLRAVRVRADMQAADLVEYDRQYRSSSEWFAGLLLDAFAEGYGGSGKVFDWSLIPKEIAPRLVLSGGLSAQNATEAVCQVRPWAVDVSSGVESAKGIKDAARIAAFIGAVRAADTAISR